MTTISIAACCTSFYGHPLARFLLGDSFHPGGLELTNKLLRLANITADGVLLDAGSGLGTSAIFAAKTFGCRVTGITLEASGVAAARKLAASEGVTDRVAFVQGDLSALAPSLGPFNAVLLECVMSTLPEKSDALRTLIDRLPTGGRVAVSDITLEGVLPVSLRGPASSALCLDGALSFDGYRELLGRAGLALEVAEPVPHVAASFVRHLRGRLLIAEAAVGLGKIAFEPEALATVRRYMREVTALVESGRLSYALFVAHRS
ncbi:MAG: methyltransferase domain-containing protein [Chloroflexi bacterium]|nr:methyltransferase domain-containing protein [Chloroflexota bacterium]